MVADLLHEIEQEVDVMNGSQTQAENLVTFNQVANISSTVVLAGVAIALLVDWTEVAGILSILDY